MGELDELIRTERLALVESQLAVSGMGMGIRLSPRDQGSGREARCSRRR